MWLILEHTLAQIRDFCNLSTVVSDYTDSFSPAIPLTYLCMGDILCSTLFLQWEEQVEQEQQHTFQDHVCVSLI